MRLTEKNFILALRVAYLTALGAVLNSTTWVVTLIAKFDLSLVSVWPHLAGAYACLAALIGLDLCRHGWKPWRNHS